MSRAQLKVEGMSCNHCKASVESSLMRLSGVTRAEVSLANGSVEVDYEEGKVTLATIMDTIRDAGYEVVE